MTVQDMLVSWPLPTAQAAPSNPAADTAFARITRLALAIEADPSQVEEWYRSVRIQELGDMTAKELVSRGDLRLVVDFLHAIRRGERG